MNLLCLLTLGTGSASWAWVVSGTVRDPNGVPIFNLDVNVRDSESGVILPIADSTDNNGFYNLTVPTGTYDFIYLPLPEEGLATLTIWEVSVLSNATIDAQMPVSAVLSGRVENSGGVGIADVDLDVDDALTGRRIETPDDNTDGNGNFSIFVPEGFLNVMYEAPVGSGYADGVIWSLVVNHDLNFDVALSNGWEISGRVTNPQGAGVANADIDVDDAATGERLHTSHDNTDANGYYSIMVPTGTYDITYEPPAVVSLAARQISSQTINGNRVINQTLQTGYSVTGTIRDGGNSPVPNCDVDVLDSGSGQVIPTPQDNSDESGFYQVVVPAGTYNFVYQPPQGSGIGEATIPNVTINQNRVQNATLPLLFIQEIVLEPSRASIFPGDQLLEGITIFNHDTQSRRVQVTLNALLPNGNVFPILPPFPTNGVNLNPGGQAGGTLPITVPPNAPGGLEATLRGYILDFSQGDTLNLDTTDVKILDANNLPPF